MKLKVGDIVIEYDGIITLVYKIVEIDGKKAIGETYFEGEKYHVFYKTKYLFRNHIQPFFKQKNIKDLTIRRLVKKYEHSGESK